MNKWPAPVLRLFLGQSTTAEMLQAADAPNARTKQNQMCEANFYSGVWELGHGTKEGAARLFRLAADGCPRNFDERFAATSELKQLGR